MGSPWDLRGVSGEPETPPCGSGLLISWKFKIHTLNDPPEHAILVDVHNRDLCRSVWDYPLLGPPGLVHISFSPGICKYLFACTIQEKVRFGCTFNAMNLYMCEVI